jgi:hypothetical protein
MAGMTKAMAGAMEMEQRPTPVKLKPTVALEW